MNPEHIDHDGNKWILASIPSFGRMKAKLPGYAAANLVIPRADWKPVDRRGLFGPEYIYDQNGFGSCVGDGWAGGLTRVRVIAGMKSVRLSPAYCYSLINGDQDNGAIISDGIEAVAGGICSFDTVGNSPIYRRQIPAAANAERARFRAGPMYHCSTWDELCSAIQLDFIPVYGYMVGNNFEHFDKYGVAGHDNGPGNHCNHADGLVLLPDGRWVIDDVNSWKPSWGPFKNGRVYIDEQHLFGGGDQPDVCVIKAAGHDPQEPNVPPVAVP